MKNTQLFSKIYLKDELFRILIYLITIIWVINLGVSVANDSTGYEAMSPFRSVGYPLYIKLTTLFGLIHHHISTVLVSLAMGLLSIHFFVNFLKFQLNLSKVSVVSVTVILVTPYFLFQLANVDISECLAYPLFLFSITYFFKAAFEKSARSAISYFILSSILVLVRSQFTFLHVLSFLLVIYLIWHSSNKIKSALRLFGILFLSIISISLTDRVYHLIVHHRFAVTPFTGIQLETPALYNATASDTALFSDPLKRALLDTVLTCLKNNPTYNIQFNTIEYSENMVFRYHKIYVFLAGRYASSFLQNYYLRKGYKLSDIDLWIAIDKVTTDVAFTLIKAHPDKYARLYFANFKSSFGDWLFMIGFFMFFAIVIFLFFKTGTNESILFLTAFLIMFLNISLVCILEEPLIRYYMYHDYLLFSILAIAVIKYIEGGNKIKPEEVSIPEK